MKILIKWSIAAFLPLCLLILSGCDNKNVAASNQQLESQKDESVEAINQQLELLKGENDLLKQDISESENHESQVDILNQQVQSLLLENSYLKSEIQYAVTDAVETVANIEQDSNKNISIEPKEISITDFLHKHEPVLSGTGNILLSDTKLSKYETYSDYTHPYIGDQNYVTINGQKIEFSNTLAISNDTILANLFWDQSGGIEKVNFSINKKYSSMRFKILTDDALFLKKGSSPSEEVFYKWIKIASNGLLLPNGAVDIRGDGVQLYSSIDALIANGTKTSGTSADALILSAVEFEVQVDISGVDELELLFNSAHLGIFDVYFMESGSDTSATSQTSQVTTLAYSNGKTMYEGEIRNNLYHGHGAYFYENGQLKYEGNFEFGLPTGDGIIYGENGKKLFEGKFVKGMLEDYGKMYYPNGNIYYEGYIFKNKPMTYTDEPSKMYFEDGTLYYEGLLYNGVFTIRGKEYYSNGKLKYDGQWSDGKYNGEGINYFPNGDLRYEGGWLNDNAHGRGTLYLLDGKKTNLTLDFKNGGEVTQAIEDVIFEAINSSVGFNLIDGAIVVTRYEIGYETDIKDEQSSLEKIINTYKQVVDIASLFQ